MMEVSDDTDKIKIDAANNCNPAQYLSLHQNIEKSEYFEAVFVSNHALSDVIGMTIYEKACNTM